VEVRIVKEYDWHGFKSGFRREFGHHRWGPHGQHGPHGPGGRFFERGAIKFVILDLLKEKPRHGYDIIRELEERSGGFYSPSPGVVYPTLQALEDQDFVRSQEEEGGKKVYSITDAGIGYLEAHKEQTRQHRDRMDACGGWTGSGEGPGAMHEMSWFFGDVARALRRTLNDPEKLAEIRQVLRDTKKKIDEIVAR
jgi:DNA-binding PadR family transcriptional regulator